MTEEKRRNALKVLALGSSAAWVKPAVSTAIIPAHAATSCAIDLSFGEVTIGGLDTPNENSGVAFEVRNNGNVVAEVEYLFTATQGSGAGETVGGGLTVFGLESNGDSSTFEDEVTNYRLDIFTNESDCVLSTEFQEYNS